MNYHFDDWGGINDEFVQSMNCFELSQFNYIRNHNDRILDLALTDIFAANITRQELLLILYHIIDPNHPPFHLFLNVVKPAHLIPNEPQRFNYTEANYTAINEKIHVALRKRRYSQYLV